MSKDERTTILVLVPTKLLAPKLLRVADDCTKTTWGFLFHENMGSYGGVLMRKRSRSSKSSETMPPHRYHSGVMCSPLLSKDGTDAVLLPWVAPCFFEEMRNVTLGEHAVSCASRSRSLSYCSSDGGPACR